MSITLHTALSAPELPPPARRTPRPRVPGLHRPGLRGPGLGWLPAVWRHAVTWKTVLRFVLLGPLIGGAPYVVFIFPIPFAYAIGALPALVAGMLFAGWYHGAGRAPGAPWRALMGALAGGAAAAATAVPFVLAAERPAWFMVGVVAAHGVPAAVLLALMQRPAGRASARRSEIGKRDHEDRPDADQQVREDHPDQRRVP